MAKPKDRNVVYEYNKNASPAYRGCRFYTAWYEPVVLDPKSNLIIIAEDVSDSEAQRLVRQTSSSNIDAFLGDLPDELRDERTDAIIRNMIKNG